MATLTAPADLANGLSPPPPERAFPAPLLIAAVLASCALHVWIAATTGLVDDEAYYRVWSLAPALSYLDHPPMIAWLIAAGRAIAGDTPFGIRLFGSLLLVAGTMLLWRTAFLLYGRAVAERATWMLLAMPLLAIGGIVITPDLPSVVCAGATLWALAELRASGNARWWLVVGITAGLGLLSKYTNLFVGATILIWLIACPENRKWLRAPELWIGGALALAIASPVAIWNAQHHWASFDKQFGRVGRSSTGGLLHLGELAGGFLALASPVIAVLAIGGLARITRSAVASRRSEDVLIASAVIPMLCYFLIHALHDRVQANWLAPLYPPLAICAGVALGAMARGRWMQATFAAALATGFAITAVIVAEAMTGFLAGHLRSDPTEQMRGWPALADAVAQKQKETGARWIATSSYATTGQLMFALGARTPVLQLDQRLRYAHLPPVDPSVIAAPALYVELERRVSVPLLESKFRKVEKLATLTRDNGAIGGAPYGLYLVSDPPRPPL